MRRQQATLPSGFTHKPSLCMTGLRAASIPKRYWRRLKRTLFAALSAFRALRTQIDMGGGMDMFGGGGKS